MSCLTNLSFTGACKSPVQFKDQTGVLFKCPYCPYAREKAAMVRGHINIQHELINFYECFNCPFTTLKQKTMKDHLVEKHSGNFGGNEPTFADIMKLKVSDKSKIRALQAKEKGTNAHQQEQVVTTTPGVTSSKGKVVSCQLCSSISLPIEMIASSVVVFFLKGMP